MTRGQGSMGSASKLATGWVLGAQGMGPRRDYGTVLWQDFPPQGALIKHSLKERLPTPVLRPHRIDDPVSSFSRN